MLEGIWVSKMLLRMISNFDGFVQEGEINQFLCIDAVSHTYISMYSQTCYDNVPENWKSFRIQNPLAS